MLTTAGLPQRAAPFELASTASDDTSSPGVRLLATLVLLNVFGFGFAGIRLMARRAGG